MSDVAKLEALTICSECLDVSLFSSSDFIPSTLFDISDNLVDNSFMSPSEF